MPSLADSIGTKLEGYTPIKPSLPLVPQSVPGEGGFRPNSMIRSPLPPINAGVDTLRQFNDADGNIPHRRVLPLPVGTGIGGGTTVTNTTVTSASSSGGTGTGTTLTAQNFTVTTPLLATGSTSFQTLNLSAKSFQLISVKATSACEIRMYGSATAMAIDAARITDAPLPAELANGLITDVVLDTAPFQWFWENRVGCNSDSPQTTNLYIAITNVGETPSLAQVNMVLLPLES